MVFFIRCLVVFIGLWVCFYAGVTLLWEEEHAVSASVLFGGMLSIVITVIYGWIDEVWIQHRKS